MGRLDRAAALIWPLSDGGPPDFERRLALKMYPDWSICQSVVRGLVWGSLRLTTMSKPDSFRFFLPFFFFFPPDFCWTRYSIYHVCVCHSLLTVHYSHAPCTHVCTPAKGSRSALARLADSGSGFGHTGDPSAVVPGAIGLPLPPRIRRFAAFSGTHFRVADRGKAASTHKPRAFAPVRSVIVDFCAGTCLGRQSSVNGRPRPP